MNWKPAEYTKNRSRGTPLRYAVRKSNFKKGNGTLGMVMLLNRDEARKGGIDEGASVRLDLDFSAGMGRVLAIQSGPKKATAKNGSLGISFPWNGDIERAFPRAAEGQPQTIGLPLVELSKSEGVIFELPGAAKKAELKAEGGRRKTEGRLHCLMPLSLVALMPSLEPHWQAWFFLGALFGMCAWILYRMCAWVDRDMRQEKMEGRELSGREALEASLARQRARVLTESEHRELLLTALSDAMRNPLRRVDIRGIPALWPLTEAQRSVWLAWLRGKDLEWGGYRWTATVERWAHLVFVRFALQEAPRQEGNEASSMSMRIEPRKATDKIIVTRAREWPTLQQREEVS